MCEFFGPIGFAVSIIGGILLIVWFTVFLSTMNEEIKSIKGALIDLGIETHPGLFASILVVPHSLQEISKRITMIEGLKKKEKK